MKKLISIITALSILLAAAPAVFGSANQPAIVGGRDGTAQFITIEGVTARNENVSIQVLSPGANVPSNDANFNASTVFSVNLTSDDSGNYGVTVQFRENDPPGEYIINVRPAGQPSVRLSFTLHSIAVLDGAMNIISTSSDVAAVRNAVLTYASSLGIRIENPALVTNGSIEMFIQNRNDTGQTTFTEAELNDLLFEALAVYEIGISSGAALAALFARHESILQLRQGNAFRRFNPSQTSITVINSRFAAHGGGYTTFAGVAAEYEISVLLYMLGRTWLDARAVIDEFGASLGLDLAAYLAAIAAIREGTARRLNTNGNINTTADLQREFPLALSAAIAAANNQTGNQNRPPSGGGGGGGGTVILPIPPAEDGQYPEYPGEIDIPDSFFADVAAQTPWAVDAVNALLEKGIISEDVNYRPNDLVTREEFAKLVVMMAGLEPQANGAGFADVNPYGWYFGYVGAARANNIVNGIDEITFGIGMNITRQDMAVMIYRAILLMGFSGEAGELIFFDSDDIADYAAEAIKYLSGSGIVRGNPNGNFYPVNFSTRAEAAQMIYNAINR